VIELKWNQHAQTAIAQIKKRQYPESLTDFAGEILLVGINYDKRTKEHQCRIETHFAAAENMENSTQRTE